MGKFKITYIFRIFPRRFLLNFLIHQIKEWEFHPIFIHTLPGISRKMGLRQVEKGYSSFCAKFLAYLMIFQSTNVLKNFEKSSNIPKIWQIICSNCLVKSIFPWYFQNMKPRVQVLVPNLSVLLKMYLQCFCFFANKMAP